MDSDQLGASEWREPQQYDAITCMFAIHYFFVSQAALHRFIENVALNLKEGMRGTPLAALSHFEEFSVMFAPQLL